MKKLIFNKLIKLILVTFVVFSFVACGGGGSSGGDDYAPAPVMQTNSDGTIQILAPSYDNDLSVTLLVNGAVVSGNKLRLQKDREASFVVQQADYDSYSWSLNGDPVSSASLQNNGKNFNFTPDKAGIDNLVIQVTKDGLRGSLSVNLVVSE